MIDLKLGNCLEVLKTIEDNSVDSIVTDPPYGIDFMGKKWDYDVPSTEIWEQCLRVLKPGGYLLAFAGTRTQHRMAVRIEDAGFEIRDMIAWVYGSGFPKSHNISKALDKVSATDDAKKWDGWGTALKPALEPITVARKPLGENTVAANVLKYGTGAINIDESRIPANGDKLGGGGEKAETSGKFKDGWKRPWMDDKNKLEEHASKVRQNVEKAELMGRFPANLIHDGSEEVTDLFPHSKSTGGKTKSSFGDTYGTFSGESLGDNAGGLGDEGSAARFFYVPKTSKKDRNDGLDKFEAKATASSEFRPNHAEKAAQGEDGNPYGRWTPTKNNHPTVKPTDLMRYLVNMVTPKGGTTLDPFMGSGSTGRGAVLGKFDFIGIELDPDYYEIAKARIKAVEDSIGVSLEDFFV